MRKWYETIFGRFLDGPDFFPLRMLSRRKGHYRSSTAALYAWTRGYCGRWLSQTTIALIPIAFLVLLYGSIALDSPSRALLLVIFCVWTVEIGIGFWFRIRCKVRRQLPQRVRCGSEFTVEHELTNRSRFPAFDLRCDPFSYCDGVRLLHPARLPELSSGARARVSARHIAMRRGAYRIYRPMIENTFPFGLFKWTCRGERADHPTLIVYPAYFPLSRFHLPIGSVCQKSGMANIARIGESPDLLGTREYRDGDEVRHIDWGGSARRGKLVVKEYEEERLKRVALIVDTQCAPRRFDWRGSIPEDPALEAALSLTAALTDYLVSSEAVVDLFAAGPEVYHLATGRNTGCLEQVWDILAGVESSSEPALEKLAPEVFRQFAEIGGVVLLLLGDDPGRRAFVEKLHDAGVALKVLILTEKTDGLPETWQAVSPRAVRAGEVRAL